MKNIPLKSLKIFIFGLVQGVGFRPFVYNLALNLGLKGEVWNDDRGVKINIYGEEKICNIFLKDLQNKLPALARIDEIKIENSDQIFDDFKIIPSKNDEKFAPILPDFAICNECKNEFYDEKNRRFHHPFINCTNCGPRFSIINSLPYDRKNTSMKEFKFCDDCLDEYQNPKNRRYHAQPVSCKTCGPRLYLKTPKNELLAKDEDAIKIIAKELKNGKIIAVKGIGGFHLICDASNLKAVSSLRIRKNRPLKPFAVMVKDSKMALKYAKFNEFELKTLDSITKPIVLAKDLNILKNIAPNIGKIGIFIAPTALHLLLFEYINFPIIATSANISGEPIIKDFEILQNKLSGVFDLALDNDRVIINPSDDSLCFCLDQKNIFLRTSRGIKPNIFRSKNSKKGCFLALGSELKNQFAIYKDGLIITSPYIGDLGVIATFDRYLDLINKFKEIYNLKFDFLISDLHPDFSATKYFQKENIKIHKIQHHKAHVLSVMLENDINEDILGFAFDGTGYGENASIWGGEIFLGNNLELNRAYHFSEFKMIGGQKAIKKISHLTFAILEKYQIKAPKFYDKFTQFELKNLKIAHEKASIQTSSLGRIFDAFASLVLGINEISFEAQAPMYLENFYDKNIKKAYEFKLVNNEIDFSDAFIKAQNDNPKIAASAFINGLANLILNLAKIHKRKVVLSGGVFANIALLEKTCELLEENNIKFYLPKNEPIGDGNIALGEINYGIRFL